MLEGHASYTLGIPETAVCKDRSAKSVLIVPRSIVSRFNAPKTVVTDNAKEFISSEVVTWLNLVGAGKVQTPEFYPQPKGIVERMVQTIKCGFLLLLFSFVLEGLIHCRMKASLY